MSDDPGFDPNGAGESGSPQEPADTAFDESELDAMLLEASSLAAELADEVRSGKPGGEAAGADLTNATGDAVLEVDAQLAEMEKMLQSASGQIGEQNAEPEAPAESATEATAPAGAAGGSTAEADSPETDEGPKEPDLNAASAGGYAESPEATEAEKPVAKAESVQAQEAPPPEPEVGISLSDEDLALVGQAAADNAIPDFDDGSMPEPGPAPAPAKGKPSKSTASAAPAAGAAEAATEELGLPAWLGPAGKVIAPLLTLGLGLCALGVKCLEALDRYLQRVPMFVKNVLGYLALATIGMALLVLLISLF